MWDCTRAHWSLWREQHGGIHGSVLASKDRCRVERFFCIERRLREEKHRTSHVGSRNVTSSCGRLGRRRHARRTITATESKRWAKKREQRQCRLVESREKDTAKDRRLADSPTREGLRRISSRRLDRENRSASLLRRWSRQWQDTLPRRSCHCLQPHANDSHACQVGVHTLLFHTSERGKCPCTVCAAFCGWNCVGIGSVSAAVVGFTGHPSFCPELAVSHVTARHHPCSRCVCAREAPDCETSSLTWNG